MNDQINKLSNALDKLDGNNELFAKSPIRQKKERKTR